MALWGKKLPGEFRELGWQDKVVNVAVLAKKAEIPGPLHDIVVMRYSFGRAVPRHISDWRMPLVKEELYKLGKVKENADLAARARDARKAIPHYV